MKDEAKLWELVEQAEGADDYRLAIAILCRLIHDRPDNLMALLKRAELWAALGEFSGAVADYNRALQLDPDCRDALFGRARCLLTGLRALDAAEEAFGKVLERDSLHTEARLKRALTRLLQGKLQAAFADYGEVLKIDATNPEALRGYVECARIEQKDKEEKMAEERQTGSNWWGTYKGGQKACSFRVATLEVDPSGWPAGTKARLKVEVVLPGGGQAVATSPEECDREDGR